MILITRPIEDAVPLKEELDKLNIESHVEPLFELQPLSFDRNKLVGAKILITSKNALRALNILGVNKDLEIYAMTDNIANFAKNLGFIDVCSCECSTAQELLQYIISTFDRKNRFIYLSGAEITRDITSICNAYGFDSERCVCYKMNPTKELSETSFELLKMARIKCIAIFSIRAAVIFRSLLAKYRFEANFFHYFLMSSKIASILDCSNIHIPQFPTQSALVDIIRNHYYTEQGN